MVKNKLEKKWKSKGGSYTLTTTNEIQFSRDNLELQKRNYQKQIDHNNDTAKELQERIDEINNIIGLKEEPVIEPETIIGPETIIEPEVEPEDEPVQ